jgi:hypothetical protein
MRRKISRDREVSAIFFPKRDRFANIARAESEKKIQQMIFFICRAKLFAYTFT